MSGSEQWRPVVGYEGYYSVSTLGRIRSEERTVIRGNGRPHRVRERILALHETTDGRRRSTVKQVSLSRVGHQQSVYVHLIVREAFEADT